MAQAKQQQKQAELDGYQEGSRWINRRPTGEEVATWFIQNAPMHDGMDPKRYVTGVTLIPAKEKIRTPKLNMAGATVLVEEEQLVYTPYVKVETRVAYFWDLMRLQDTIGVIEPAKVKQHKELRNEHLPPGFFRMVIRKVDGKEVNFLACSMQVRVYAREEQRGGRGKALMEPPAGTKMVSELTKYGEDPFVVMKAETGAVGRALGMAGMLVLPGSGVATAEDMQEAAVAAGGGGAVDAQLPDAPPPESLPTEAPADASEAPDADIRQRIAEQSARLESDNPGGFEEVKEWASERKIDLDNLKPEQLRGVLRQIERALA